MVNDDNSMPKRQRSTVGIFCIKYQKFKYYVDLWYMYNRSSSQKLSILKHVEGTQIFTISIIGNPVKNVNWEESYPELAIAHSHSGFTSQLILCLHMLILLYMLILLNTLIRLRYMMVLYYAAVLKLGN